MIEQVSDQEGSLDSTGPWVVWLAIGVLVIVAVGVMLDKNVGIEQTPPQVASAPMSSFNN
jgi:hypothetical protein